MLRLFFLFFFLSVTSSSDLNGPVTLAAVHVYQLRHTRRCYMIVSRSDLMFISVRHGLMGFTPDFHSQRCLSIDCFDHHASNFSTYSGKIYPTTSVQIIMNTRNVAKLNLNSLLEHFSVL